jgi:DNA processing protein
MSVGGFTLRRMPCEGSDRVEHAALIALLQEWDDVDPRRRYQAWSAIAKEVTRRGSARAVWNERHPLTLDDAADLEAALRRARADLTAWQNAGFEMVTVLDRQYPLLLRQIEQISPVLFATGALRADEVGVAVVGSRDASMRGRQFAAEVAEGLTKRGIAVISGLAKGIDTAAHRATVASGGRSIGVLGTGVARVYPEANRALHEHVAAAGVLVSPFWPDCPPDRHTLVLRNTTMAGLARASVVAEAGEYSGSRVHARYALTFARPLILSDLVVSSTRWGRKLAGRAGVYVASSVAEVLGVMDQVVSGVDTGA